MEKDANSSGREGLGNYIKRGSHLELLEMSTSSHFLFLPWGMSESVSSPR